MTDTAVRPSLDDLGLKYKTDKASAHHRLAHDYLVHYEQFLAPLRDESFDMLEIGVMDGASIRMWHEYFPSARIVGVDVDPSNIGASELPRFVFAKGSQADPTFLHQLVQQYKFSLIVDDGSHLWAHQIFTFQMLFPWLETGGIYICEDIQTSFGKYIEQFSGGARQSAAAYFLQIAQSVAAGIFEEVKESEDPLMHFIVKKIRSITFISHCVIIRS